MHISFSVSSGVLPYRKKLFFHVLKKWIVTFVTNTTEKGTTESLRRPVPFWVNLYPFLSMLKIVIRCKAS